MLPATLLETLAALAIQTLAITGLAALFASSATIATASARLANHIDDLIHVEHLVDSAVSRDGLGPGAQAIPIPPDTRDRIELLADLDYDGFLDTRSKEAITITITSRDRESRSLIFRVGRQSVAIGPPLMPSDTIEQGLTGNQNGATLRWFSIPFGTTRLVMVADIPKP